MMKRRRDVGSRFTTSEKMYLMELVEKHFSIIECKKSDSISTKNKNEEWQKIAIEFNAISGIHPRLPAVLKNCWENLKKRAKLEQTSRNQHYMGTGGGPPKKLKEDPNTDKVLELIQARVSGYVNTFDSDGTQILASNVTTSYEDTLLTENIECTTDVNGCIKCWKYKYEQCLYTIREKRQTLGLNYHPRYSKFVTYGDDAKLNMYDEEAQTQERAFYSSKRKNIIDGHTSRIFACAFNPKSHHELISGGWDDTVMCWDDRQPYATKHFFGVHICGEGLDFDKPGKQILTCSWQEKDCIQLWDYGSCKLIETIVPDNYQSKLYCGKIIPQTNLIICGGTDSNILRVVDINMKSTECSIRNNPGAIYAFDFGTIRRKPRKVPDTYKKISEIEFIPRLSFVTGKRLQTVDFG